MAEELRRFSAKFKAVSGKGATSEFDAASHRRSRLPNGSMQTHVRADARRVLMDTLEEMVRIGAVCGIPLAEVQTTVGDTYKRVEEHMKAQA